MPQTAHEQYYDQDRYFGYPLDDDLEDPNDTGPECMCENSNCSFHPADQYCLNPQNSAQGSVYCTDCGLTC